MNTAIGFMQEKGIIHLVTRILGLFPYQGKSHFTMCEALMRGLAAKGHQVDVYSHFPLKSPIPNYKDFSLAGSLPAVANNMTYEDVSKATGTDMIGLWIGKIGTSVCRLMDHPLFQELFYHPPRDPPYDIIVHEVSVTHCFIPWGRHLGIPIVAVVTLPLLDWLFEPLGNPINLSAEPSIFSPYAAPMSFLQRLDNFIRFKSINRDFDRFSEEHARYVEKYFGIPDRKPIELIKDVSLVLVNYDHSISGVRPFAPIVVPVGGLHILDHNDSLSEALQTWLDQTDRGFVYVSFGSMTRFETFPRHVIDTFYRSFQSIAPVRVLLKIAKPEEMPAGMPDNVLVQTWLPQIQILKHKNIKAFVTHGGLMGSQESIFYGVPMIGIPLFADQFFNIESYAKKKIALNLNLYELTEEALTSALKEIIYDPSYWNAAQQLSAEFRDRPLSPIDTATFWIEYIVRRGEDALKSPLVHMPWWQASLLDVYIFFVLFLIIGSLLVKIMFNMFVKKIIPKEKNL
ncbi:hypothetical protein TKK_0011182 [Trichogramma kaykai]|uniref:UDP-glucuronosyltransferase n=1 Tax=Trichogramma kaykai TaxID=54128 RepID=A0ABD2WV73_9HYME